MDNDFPSSDHDRYSRKNPPPSEEAALTKLEDIREDRVRIETQLEHRTPDSFPTDQEFRDWQHRAVSALAHIRCEQQFLEKWLKDLYNPPRPYIPPKYDPEAVLRIRNFVLDQARELSASYAISGSVALPSDPEIARYRETQLCDAKRDVEQKCARITSEWQRNSLPPADLAPVKEPLQKILSDIDRESGMIKDHLRRITGKWWSLVVGALECAERAGCVLSESEQEALEGLKKFHNIQ